MMQQIYPVTEHPYEYELNKDFHFAAAHYIRHEDAGKCQNIHGHTYYANVCISQVKSEPFRNLILSHFNLNVILSIPQFLSF